ncbi:TM2 domain-containing protein [Spartinivicinus ruber]|uniref:TM2 domain-containing protein n=1 Tax=Spartinivicinus ruber TaxID=2683272 RepID=UPI0013D8CDDE|nr:TM2 domain-containing protein [Spartinivicinus ruber]
MQQAQATPYASPESALERPVYCRNCGNKLSPKAVNCPSCGEPQLLNGRNKVAAALLAFFLGALGIHRFYLGQWWGIFYLLFFWTGIPSLVSLIETIVFACTSDARWSQKHGHKPPRSGWLYAIVSVVLFFFIMGLLAAIAIPAYEDYTERAKAATQQVL